MPDSDTTTDLMAALERSLSAPATGTLGDELRDLADDAMGLVDDALVTMDESRDAWRSVSRLARARAAFASAQASLLQARKLIGDAPDD